MSYHAPFLRRLWRLPVWILEKLLSRHPSMRFLHETRGTQTPVTFEEWFRQEVRGVNIGPYWPLHPSSVVTRWRNVVIGAETSPGRMPGCYIQALGPVIIGDYTQTGPNVSIISSNHRPEELREHHIGRVDIGAYCWLGAGAVILPDVVLGDHTIVGANSVVTKSFPEGYCVIAGNPARKIRSLDPAECPRRKSPHEYHGFVPHAEFDAFRARELKV